MRKVILKIVKCKNGEIVKELDVTGKSDREIDRIIGGMIINLDHDKYQIELPYEAQE